MIFTHYLEIFSCLDVLATESTFYFIWKIARICAMISWLKAYRSDIYVYVIFYKFDVSLHNKIC